ncbi:MAG: hypothetical protein LIO92_07260 [Clostridiales bacterium]|nr:hypothetical protein [Clostridiales bacterium]
MKVAVYNTVRGGTERFRPYADKYDNIELVAIDCPPTLETLDKLKEFGCEAMIYTSDHQEGEEFFKKIAENGVRYVCCCCTGYDHFNISAMKKYGLKGANVPYYSPNAISEHTVMLVLAALRHFRTQILNVEHGNYQLAGLMGREIRNMSIGIVGAGRIGYVTMQCLSGFRPGKMYAYDPFPNERVKEYAQFTTLDDLYAKCDVIIYHAIYNEKNHHMVNAEAIRKMKDGVILINVSRGGLFDTDAVLAGIESGKLGGVCLDVIEGEGILKKQKQYDICPISSLSKLLAHPNVIFTPHAAFFTDEADSNMNETTIENLESYITTGSCDKEVVKG